MTHGRGQRPRVQNFPDFLSFLIRLFWKFVAAGPQVRAELAFHARRMRYPKFVFVRVDSWLECAKRILWSSPVDAYEPEDLFR
jgi:hypothetical protein